MAEIANAVTLGRAELSIIEAVKARADFTHVSWSSEDLEPVRATIREYYRREQRGICAYCRGPVSIRGALNCHLEHIAPKSKYLDFMFDPKNLCVICADCNTIKRDQEALAQEPETVLDIGKPRKRYPRTTSAFLIVHPHFDQWDDHIQKVGKYFVDKTPKGHFTIGACVLNRHLRQFGWELPLVDDAAMRDAMTAYLNTNDPVAKAAALVHLMRLMNQI